MVLLKESRGRRIEQSVYVADRPIGTVALTQIVRRRLRYRCISTVRVRSRHGGISAIHDGR